MSDFKESKLVFFEAKEGQADKFVPKIQAVEEKVQAEKKKANKDSGKADIVDESRVKSKIEGIEKKIKESPVSDKYKKQLGKSLTTLLDKKDQDLKKVDTKKEDKLKALFDKILADLDDFDKQPDVKDIYETIEPFFKNKEQIKPVINLKTYRRGSGHWQKINAQLDAKGIKKDQIERVQKLLKVKVDGKAGPQTINALSAMLGLGVKVEFDNKNTLYAEQTKSVEEEEAKKGEKSKDDDTQTDGKIVTKNPKQKPDTVKPGKELAIPAATPANAPTQEGGTAAPATPKPDESAQKIDATEAAKAAKALAGLKSFNAHMAEKLALTKKGDFEGAIRLEQKYQAGQRDQNDFSSPFESKELSKKANPIRLGNFMEIKRYMEAKGSLEDSKKIDELLRIAQGYINQANLERKFEQQEGFRVGYMIQGPSIMGLLKANIALIAEINPEKGIRITITSETTEEMKKVLTKVGIQDGWVKAADLRKAIIDLKMGFSHCEEGMTRCVAPKNEGTSVDTEAKAKDLVEEANVLREKVNIVALMDKTTITSERAIRKLSSDIICKDGKVSFTAKFLTDFENLTLDQKKRDIKLAKESLLKATIIEATEKEQDPTAKIFNLGKEALVSGNLPEARFHFTKFLDEVSRQKDKPEFKEMISFAREQVRVFNIASIKRLQKINDQLADPKRYESMLKDPVSIGFLKRFVATNKANLEFQLKQAESGTMSTSSHRDSLLQRKEATISATRPGASAYGGLSGVPEKDNSDQLMAAWNCLVSAEFSTAGTNDKDKIQDEYLSAARSLHILGQTDMASEYFEVVMKDDIESVGKTISPAQREQMRAKVIAENEKNRPKYESAIRSQLFDQIKKYNETCPPDRQKPLEISAAELKDIVDKTMAEGVEDKIKKIVMCGMETANKKGTLEKGGKKAWKEYESMVDPNDRWYIISDKEAEKIVEQVVINGVIMAISGGVGSLAAASVRAFMIAHGIRSGLALGAAGFVAESVGFELASRTIHATVLGEKGLFMPEELAKGLGQSMMMFGAIGVGNKVWRTASETAGLATKEALAGAGMVGKALRKGADYTGQLATEAAIFSSTSDNSFVESVGDILMLRVGGKLVSPITGAMHEAGQKKIEAATEKAAAETAKATKPVDQTPPVSAGGPAEPATPKAKAAEDAKPVKPVKAEGIRSEAKPKRGQQNPQERRNERRKQKKAGWAAEDAKIPDRAPPVQSAEPAPKSAAHKAEVVQTEKKALTWKSIDDAVDFLKSKTKLSSIDIPPIHALILGSKPGVLLNKPISDPKATEVYFREKLGINVVIRGEFIINVDTLKARIKREQQFLKGEGLERPTVEGIIKRITESKPGNNPETDALVGFALGYPIKALMDYRAQTILLQKGIPLWSQLLLAVTTSEIAKHIHFDKLPEQIQRKLKAIDIEHSEILENLKKENPGRFENNTLTDEAILQKHGEFLAQILTNHYGASKDDVKLSLGMRGVSIGNNAIIFATYDIHDPEITRIRGDFESSVRAVDRNSMEEKAKEAKAEAAKAAETDKVKKSNPEGGQETDKARSRRMNTERREYHEVKRATEVVSIPDVHGDVVALKNSLKNQGLIDANGQWIGGKKVIQFLGDYIDRGSTNLATLDYLKKISKQAKDAGGRVDLMMGNHEALMIGTLLGDHASEFIWRQNGGNQVLDEVAAAHGLKGHDADVQAMAILRKACFEPGGKYHELIHSFKPVSQVDDVLYVHAGISPKWAAKIRQLGVDGVNRQWSEALGKAEKGDFTLFNEFNEIGQARGGKADIGSLFWIDFEAEMETMSESKVAKIAGDLKAAGINAVVVGHSKMKNPKMAENFKKYGIKIIASDVGMSEGYRKNKGSGKGGVRIGINGKIVAESSEGSHVLHEGEKQPAEAQPEIKTLKTNNEILGDYLKKTPQPALTQTLISEDLFRIEYIVKIAGTKYHIGPVLKYGGRLFATMMVDRGNGVLMPRVMYTSNSQPGTWRCPRGYDGSKGTYSKGVLKGGYTQETLVIPEISEHLTAAVQQNNILHVADDPIKKHFVSHSESMTGVDTYGDENIQAYSAPELSPFLEPGYQPGKFTARNATEYFRYLDSHFPPGFVPDFSRPPVGRSKNNSEILGDITYETYETQYRNETGSNRLHWTMAYTKDGKVWVERIIFPDSPVTSYGTSRVNLLTGLISSKPLEYNEQVSGLKHGIEYNDIGNLDYVDITPLLDNLLPIQEFRRKKNIYRQAQGRATGSYRNP